MITNDVDEAILLADRIVALKPGPNATLGAEFRVSIPRPRNAAALAGPIRSSSACEAPSPRYLMDIASERAAAGDGGIVLPSVAPIDLQKRQRGAGITRGLRTRRRRPGVERRYLEYSNLNKVYPTPQGPLTVVEDVEPAASTRASSSR